MSIRFCRIGILQASLVMCLMTLAACARSTELPAQALSTSCQSGFLCDAIEISDACFQRTPPCLPGFDLVCDGGGCGGMDCSGQCCRCVPAGTAGSSQASLPSSSQSSSSTTVQSSASSRSSQTFVGATSSVPYRADMQATIVADKISARPGDTLRYTVTYRNNGPHRITSAYADLSIPLTQASSNNTVCAKNGVTGFRCNMGVMESGASVTVVITGTVAANHPCNVGSPLIATTQVGAAGVPDENQGNNYAGMQTQVGCNASAATVPFPMANMTFTITASPVTSSPGTDHTYTIRIANNSQEQLQNVVLDTLNYHDQVITSLGDARCTKRSDISTTCAIGVMNPGQIVTITMATELKTGTVCPGETVLEGWVYRSDDPQRLSRKLWNRAVVPIHCIDPSLTQCPQFPQVTQKVALHGERSAFMTTSDKKYYVYTDLQGGLSRYLKGFNAETCVEQVFLAPAQLDTMNSVWTPSVSDNGKILALELPWTAAQTGKISIIDRATSQKNTILSNIGTDNGLNDAIISRSGQKIVFTAKNMPNLDTDPATNHANADLSSELYLWSGGVFTQLTNYVPGGQYSDTFIATPRFETPERFISIDLGFDPATGQDFQNSPFQFALFLYDTQTETFHRVGTGFNLSPRSSHQAQIDATVADILGGNQDPPPGGTTGGTGGQQCVEGAACGPMACGDCSVVNGTCRRLCVQPVCTGGSCTAVYEWSDCDAMACMLGYESIPANIASAAGQAFKNLAGDIARSLSGLASLLNPFDE